MGIAALVFDLDLGVADHGSPFGDFQLQESGQFSRRRALRNRAQILEPGLDRWVDQRRVGARRRPYVIRAESKRYG